MGLRIVLPLIALCGGAGGRAHSADSPHLKYMSYYGLNPPAMKGWVNLGLEQWRDPNCEVGIDACNMSGVLDAWRDYKIPSFFGNVPASGSDAILQRGIGVAPGWEKHLEKLVSRIKPHMGKGKALRGVFLGETLGLSGLAAFQTYTEPCQGMRFAAIM